MIRKTNRYSRLLMMQLSALFMLVPALTGCSGDETGGSDASHPGAPETFVLDYSIPDSETDAALNVAETRAGTTPALGSENKIEKLLLLFFEQDDYGNGAFVGSLTGTQDGNSLEKTGSVEMTLGGSINADTDYNVLVIANAEKYTNVADINTFCTTRTENLVKFQLRPQLPVAGDIFTVPDGYLPMSGTAIKRAGKDLKVTLQRAVVRVDINVNENAKDNIILEEAMMANIAPVVPLFSAPWNENMERLKGVSVVSVDNAIIGGLYATENYTTSTTGTEALTQRTCLLVKCKEKDYAGDLCWYRVDVNIDAEGMQYLKRNNVYTVTINSILGPGAETPDEAYDGDPTLIGSVTIPGNWKNSGIKTPDVDVN